MLFANTPCSPAWLQMGTQEAEPDAIQPGDITAPAPLGLPPINAASPLIALASCEERTPPSDVATPTPAFSFDTSELQLALTRSRQQTGASGGLRRATSAPHSMDTLGHMPTLGGPSTTSSSYLAPSGGPMRRVSSSLGMRRSSSFFWTPAAHHDFERAVATLTARGAECTAAAIMAQMGQRADLQLGDVDKHLRKRLLVQRRVLQNLNDRPGVHPERAATSTSGVASSGMTSPTGRVAAHVPAFGNFRSSPTMAAVAEEHPVVSPLPEGLAQQFSAQQHQHLQLAKAREALVTHTEAQILSQQQAEAH